MDNNLKTIELLMSIVNSIDISEHIENNSYFELFIFKIGKSLSNESFRSIILLDAIEINKIVIDIISYSQSDPSYLINYQKNKKRILNHKKRIIGKKTSYYILYKETFIQLKKIIERYKCIFNITNINVYTKNILDTLLEDIYDVFFSYII
jgi:hypothetical protein